MSAYTDTIRNWAMRTERAGELPDADGTGEVGLGREAGQRLAVRFALRVADERVDDVRFQVFGCGFTIAACAVAADLAAGKNLDDLLAISAAAVDRALDGLPDERGYCADLAVAALHAAVASARSDSRAVQSSQPADTDHGPRVGSTDPVYRSLMDSPAPPGIPAEDRHLFACLLAVSHQEPHDQAAALGLTTRQLALLRQSYFPDVSELPPRALADPATEPPPHNAEILGILLSHLPGADKGRAIPAALWLAHIIAARAAHPGHLWVAMGLFERPELSAAIRRHLPSLAAANHQGMRWKRYLFKQVCNLHGATLCKTPDCGDCSDFALCFAPED